MDKSELPFLSASELSRRIASREVSPVDAAEAYLDRIDDLDFKFNAYLTVARDMAMDAARNAEREIAAGNHRGPMHGVPVAVKGPVPQRRNTQYRRLPHSGRQRPRRGRHCHCQPQECGCRAAGQDQPDRVRHHWLLPPLQHAAQSLGPEHLRRGLQQRLRGRHGRLSLRHLPRRGYRRLHPLPRHVVRPCWSAADLGAWSAATASCAASGLWTPSARSPGP